MYYEFFGFREPPFSIAPDPRYLYLSERHKEALAHLMYGVQGQGGFIVITGEVGTGKTTVCRCFIENVPENVDIALVLNPRLSARELLSSICDELGIRHPSGSSIKRLIDLVNHHLLEAHANGRHQVLIIDEAQNLSADVLEQLRLLTNLETAEKKLLQIVLLGQPELQEILETRQLRQLSQRITARYHLDAIGRDELPAYLRYRLSVAGQRSEFFSSSALGRLYRLSGGIPRVINLICDRALLGAYSEGTHEVGKKHIDRAAKEVLGNKQVVGKQRQHRGLGYLRVASITAAILAAVVVSWAAVERLGSDNADGVASKGQAAEVVEEASPASEQTTEEGGDEAPSVASDSPAKEPETASKAATEQVEVVEQPFIDGPDGSPTEPRVPPNWLAVMEKPGKDQTQAYRNLFSRWGFEYEPTEYPYACDFAETIGLRCLHRQGNWRSIEQLDRPVILRLFDDEGNPRYATLVNLENGIARLMLGDERLDLPLETVDRYWLGDYSLVWRLPPYQSTLVPSGEAVSEEAWLSARLMELITTLESNVARQDELIASSLQEQIQWYQSRNGLIPDGIAGAKTLIQMNSDLYPSIPTLAPSRRQTAEVR
ncbi:ExeA family protein [Marinobacter nanhaiticus D15-8W]|uniref:Peptidoglycan-binding protein n=1 Tax=Marinobacter nanhaiticus D15-8W TaxID=626887 RepID=N6VVQ6_9GAMM|nr:peptidoglycan-binding protein [Marinobacter nanhaiticus D15-8W]BES71637.1 ExeA family protein [Marinobacter nanhaiticus D15-8W]